MIDDVATANLKLLCVSDAFRSVPVEVQTTRYDNTRQKVDMAALLLQELGANHHNRGKNIGKQKIVFPHTYLYLPILGVRKVEL